MTCNKGEIWWCFFYCEYQRLLDILLPPVMWISLLLWIHSQLKQSNQAGFHGQCKKLRCHDAGSLAIHCKRKQHTIQTVIHWLRRGVGPNFLWWGCLVSHWSTVDCYYQRAHNMNLFTIEYLQLRCVRMPCANIFGLHCKYFTIYFNQYNYLVIQHVDWHQNFICKSYFESIRETLTMLQLTVDIVPIILERK